MLMFKFAGLLLVSFILVEKFLGQIKTLDTL